MRLIKMNIHNTLIPSLALCMQIHTANVTRGWKGKCIRYWGRQTGFMGRGSSWASTLEAGIQVSWNEALREHRHLRQTDRSRRTKLFVSIDTWGRQTGLMGRGSSWASTLEAGRQSERQEPSKLVYFMNNIAHDRLGLKSNILFLLPA